MQRLLKHHRHKLRLRQLKSESFFTLVCSMSDKSELYFINEKRLWCRMARNLGLTILSRARDINLVMEHHGAG